MGGEAGPGQGPRQSQQGVCSPEDTSLMPERAHTGRGDPHTEGSLPPQAASGEMEGWMGRGPQASEEAPSPGASPGA